ncbi:MAG: hypothetical protein M3Y57_05930 [Acidobacteriota bacterium]|nr:hypothetical protein [Acidobacteriota bacterium]
MYRACVLLLMSLLLATSGFALGHSKRLKAIDRYCAEVQQVVSSTSPFVFAGPDPWVQLDEEPAEMPSEGLALVYTAGPDIRWVFLRLVDSDEGWAEDINYYFRQDGTVVKRVRQVESPGANVSLEVVTYYEGGRVLKENTHHHSLNRGHEDGSKFIDPDAPVFWTLEDLPFPEIPDLWRRLA